MVLEQQLTFLSSELEKERENISLLVAHPEGSSTGGRDLQKHITANTIRILLLEEQNTEMRETMVQQARLIKNKRKEDVRKKRVVRCM